LADGCFILFEAGSAKLILFRDHLRVPFNHAISCLRILRDHPLPDLHDLHGYLDPSRGGIFCHTRQYGLRPRLLLALASELKRLLLVLATKLNRMLLVLASVHVDGEATSELGNS